MKTAWNDGDRRELQNRMAALAEDRKPLWGKMTAHQMVCHLAHSLRMATGDLHVAPKKMLLRFWPLKQLVIYFAPFPKNAPTAPELIISGTSNSWNADVNDLRALCDLVAARAGDAGRWPPHPAFGQLTPRAWGVLIYRHLDHHLRQFGV